MRRTGKSDIAYLRNTVTNTWLGSSILVVYFKIIDTTVVSKIGYVSPQKPEIR